jgi:Na+/H+ antiporter NhaA
MNYILDNKSSNGPDSAIVAGAVIGVIGFTVVVFIALICFFKRYKTK